MYYCPLCGYSHERMFVIKNHFRNVHDPTTCYVCKRKYKTEYALAHHCLSKKDDDHLILYYLVKVGRNKSVPSMISIGLRVSELLKQGRRASWAQEEAQLVNHRSSRQPSS